MSYLMKLAYEPLDPLLVGAFPRNVEEKRILSKHELAGHLGGAAGALTVGTGVGLAANALTVGTGVGLAPNKRAIAGKAATIGLIAAAMSYPIVGEAGKALGSYIGARKLMDRRILQGEEPINQMDLNNSRPASQYIKRGIVQAGQSLRQSLELA